MANSSDEHGRIAKSPGEIPPHGWKDIVIRVKNGISQDNISIIAAGIAFYAFLALFPAIAATISIYGLIITPSTVQKQLSELAQVLPPQSRELVQQQLSQIAASSPGALGWSLVISLLFSIWSAKRGTQALFQGINIAYNEKDERGLIKGNAMTLLFTFIGIIIIIISMILVVGLPIAFGNLGLPDNLQVVFSWLRWLLLAVLIVSSLSVFYRFAPDRERPQWKWVSWGSVISTVIWIAGSWAFSYYVSHFGSYNATYGSLAAVVILLLWFSLSAFIILLGAEINAEIEHQTLQDTTTGKAMPLGNRGADKADNLGEAA